MLLVVAVDGAHWIVDVGFGGEGLLEPIELAPGVESRQGGWTFRVDLEDGGAWVLRSLHPDGWFDLYAFGTEPRSTDDYAILNHYLTTHPSSPFLARPVVQRTGPDVRHVLVGPDLTTTRPDGSSTTHRPRPEELPGTLRDVFGIDLPGADAAAITAFARRAAGE